MSQRLNGAASLDAAVVEVFRNLPESFWLKPCKRMRDWKGSGKGLSCNTAAYSEARQRLPLAIAEQSSDRIFKELMARLSPPDAPDSHRAFLLDGSGMRLAYSPATAKKFPAGSNQHGDNHWPVMRVLVAHDLQTGLAMRPQWGPMYGPEAISEQRLLIAALERLPANSVVLADCNFGVFSVAWTACQQGRPVLLRMTAQRAQRLAGGALPDGLDRQIDWKPTKADRRSLPDLPPDACVHGRLIARLVQPEGKEPFLLIVFTTLQDPADRIVEMYGQRWYIETDLRTLKSDLHMDQLSCASPEMAAKEIEMAFTAYNLVRAMICLAAQDSGLPPRRFSFTRASRIVRYWAPLIATAPTDKQAQSLFGFMIDDLKRTKLPNRKRKRKPYPRAAWGSGAKFPTPKRPTL